MKGVFTIIKFIGSFIMGLGSMALGLFVLLTLIVVALARQPDQAVSVPDGAVLVLQPEGTIVEQTQIVDSYDILFSEFQNLPSETSVHDVVRALKLAKNDDRIAALALSTDYMFGAAPSHLHTMAQAIKDFKESGKKVYAVSTAYSQSDYLLAAQADKIYMNSAGSVLLNGYGSYPTFFKELLDKIGATINVFRVGTFKSAVEPYIRNDMSPEAKEANQEFLNALWRQYENSVVEARGMEPGKISANISDMSAQLRNAGGDFAKLAFQTGLVDQLSDRTTWRNDLAQEYGFDSSGSSFKQIHFQQYLAAAGNGRSSSNHIAVIVAQGEIVMGYGPNTVAASETLVDYIRQARANANTKAIVLRVDSPGGSAFASELIRQELSNAQNDGIKVIASMGPVAASGGYWIAASADEIWAAPTSITGSIGIFGVIPTYENTLAKVGVYTDGVGTTPLAGAFNITRPLTPEAKDIIQQSIESGYSQFLNLVAENRQMTVEDVDKIAQGRVWVGEKAKELGLVDHLGNFDDAVAAAARAAGVEGDYQVVTYREQPDQWTAFWASVVDASVLTSFIPKAQPSVVLEAALALTQEAEFLLKLNDPMGRYLVCFECKVR